MCFNRAYKMYGLWLSKQFTLNHLSNTDNFISQLITCTQIPLGKYLPLFGIATFPGGDFQHYN